MSRTRTTAEGFAHSAEGTRVFDSDGNEVLVRPEDAHRLISLLVLDLDWPMRRVVHEMTRPECQGPCSAEARRAHSAAAIGVGDRVSVPLHPRGRARGEVVESDRAFCPLCRRPALAVLLDDAEGATVSMPGKPRKLKGGGR